MSKKTKMEPIGFSLRKQEIYDRRNRNIASGKSPMKEADRIFKSLPQEVQNKIIDKQRKDLFGGEDA